MDNIFLKDFLLISKGATLIFLLLLLFLFSLIFYLQKRNVKLNVLIGISSILGVILGVLIQFTANFKGDIFLYEVTTWLEFFGNGYLRILQMVVAPFIIISLCHGILTINIEETNKKLLVKTVLITLITTFISGAIGLFSSILFKTGRNFQVNITELATAREMVSVPENFRTLIPNNFFMGISSNNAISILIIAVILSFAVKKILENNCKSVKAISNFVENIYEIVNCVPAILMKFMPYGTIVFWGNMVALTGFNSVLEVAPIIFTLYIAMVFQFVVQMLLLFTVGVKPWEFIKKSIGVVYMAFVTRSSFACLPYTIDNLKNQHKIKDLTGTFVPIFCNRFGMQGCSGVFTGFLVGYIFNVTNTPITLPLCLVIILIITGTSFGIAGLSGTSTLSLTTTLSALGMLQYYSLLSPILALENIIDMGRTALNVNGALVNTNLIKHLKFNDEY